MIHEKIEDDIVIATLEHGKMNSITMETLRSLDEIVKKVNTDENLKGIIITGAGKIFSSGFDLPMFLSFKEMSDVIDFFIKEEEIIQNLFLCKKPVISAINGHCVAAGMILAMASDYRIAKNHPKIKIGMSEIKIGLPLSLTQAGVMAFGLDSEKKYRDIMYFGEMYDVDRAKELKIVDELADEENLLSRAKEIIKIWIDNPGRSFIKLKEVLKQPVIDDIKNRMDKNDWQKSLNCFFDPAVKNTLEAVQAMMDK